MKVKSVLSFLYNPCFNSSNSDVGSLGLVGGHQFVGHNNIYLYIYNNI